MGCQVQLSTEQPYFRSDSVVLVVLLHLFRALSFLAFAIVMANEFIVLLIMGLVEFFAAYWVWSLRMDAWGLSMGMALLYLLYPSLWVLSPLWSIVVSASVVIQILALFVVRMDGGFSFNQIYSVDSQETRSSGAIQNRMLQLVVIAQSMKAFAMLFAGVMFLTFETISPSPPWLGLIPVGPFAFGLAVLDLAAAVQLRAGAEWGFHLTLVMVPLSVVETFVTFLSPILLISIWIAMLMAPCWVKDGFYARFFKRKQSQRVSNVGTPKK